MAENLLTVIGSSPLAQTDQLSTVQSITSGTSEFSFELSDASLYQNFYFDNNDNNVLTCERTDETSTTVTCKTGDLVVDFTQTNTYKIYYKGCSSLLETGLSVITTSSSGGDSGNVEISSISFGDGNVCTLNPKTSIKLVAVSDPGQVTSVELTNSDSTVTLILNSCNVQNNIIICSTISTLQAGTYTISTVNGNKIYSYTAISSTNLQFVSGTYPFSEENASISKQEFGGNFSYLSLKLASDDTTVPTFYLIGEEVTCSSPNPGMPAMKICEI